MTHNTIKSSELLDGAADYIEKHGLYKGDYFEGYDGDVDPFWVEAAADYVRNGQEPKCCTIGALAMVGARADVEIGWQHIEKAADLMGVDVIPFWNDKPSQRKGRVVAKLRKAAAKAREAGE